MLDPVDEGGEQAVGFARRLNVGQALEEAPEHDVDLLAGQVRAEAEVRAGGAEADVGIGRAPHVEGVGVVEHVLVPVGRVVVHDHPVALVHLGSPSTVSSATVRRIQITGEPQRTISSMAVGATPGRVGLPQRPLVRVLGQRQQPVADGVACGLVAGHDQQDEERRHLGVGQLLAVDVRVDQGRGHVLGRLLPADRRPGRA